MLNTADGKLYRYVGGAWTDAVSSADIAGQLSGAQIAGGAIDLAKFAPGLTPVQVVSVLPAPGVPGRVAFLTTDQKLYRDTGATWTATSRRRTSRGR